MSVPDIEYDGTPKDLKKFLDWIRSESRPWPEINCPLSEGYALAEVRGQLAHTLALYGRTWEALDAVVRCCFSGESEECRICEADPDHRHTEDCPVLEAERVLNHLDRG
jgi:hypothetical protein